jgi:transposase
MTLPVCYSWFPRGKTLSISYEAPQGRRVNVIGAYFSHGPLAGRFCYESFAALPKHAREAKRKTPDEVAHSYGLTVNDIGPIDAQRFISFIWKSAGRPEIYRSDWKRDRPLMVVLDNYQVHKCQAVKDIQETWERSDIFLVYLPSYSPELSQIEPIWNDVKHNQMRRRSYQQVSDLKRAVDGALSLKAERLLNNKTEITNDQRMAA